VSNLLFEFIREELKFIKHAKGGARYKSTGASGLFICNVLTTIFQQLSLYSVQ
jgi:hypothetical protein